MQKLEDVVIPMNKNEIKYLVGNEVMEVRPLPVYSDVVCEFLDCLSRELRNDVEARVYPDILTFAFWCRKSNITKLKEGYVTTALRVGRGIVFHIAPSNVPINFAFSLVFGMLAGNGNVVRISEKEYPQTEIVCRILKKLLKDPLFEIIRKQTQVVSYGHRKEINDFFSAKCDMRVIWGGDKTIEEIRQSPIPSRCTEITFADRFSFAVFSENAIKELEEIELKQLAEKFYNDTYLMDQNACSSPHLILWKSQEKLEGKDGRKRFWKALADIAKKYELEEKKVIDKYTLLCEKIVQVEEIENVECYDNLLYVASLKNIPESVETLRGKFGLFYEATIINDVQVCHKITGKTQTCVVYGVDKKELLNSFLSNHMTGVDRIVSVGEAMDIGVYWDGYDVIGSLSRGITVSNL